MFVSRKRLFTLYFSLLMLLVACSPDIEEPAGAENITTPTATPATSCELTDGGVHTSEDVACYLTQQPGENVVYFSESLALLHFDADGATNPIGAAILYHIPSVSTLVFDRFGDVDPELSTIMSRQAIGAFANWLNEGNVMADLQSEIQNRWQTQTSGPSRLKVADVWPDTDGNILLVALVGGNASDTISCTDQLMVADGQRNTRQHFCSSPNNTSRVTFLASSLVYGRNSPTTLMLGSITSDEFVRLPGEQSDEQAIYLLVADVLGYARHVVNDEFSIPTPAFLEQAAANEFVLDNDTDWQSLADEQSMHYLFLDQSEIIMAELVPQLGTIPANGELNCDELRRAIYGFYSFTSFSPIVYNADKTAATVYVQRRCGTDGGGDALVRLSREEGSWHVVSSAIFMAPAVDPTLQFAGRQGGCGTGFVYQGTADRTEYLTVSFRAFELGLTSEKTTLDIEPDNPQLAVRLELYAAPADTLGEFPYCNDVGPSPIPAESWNAVEGTITIKLSEDPPEDQCSGPDIRATIVLENVTFSFGDENITLDYQEFKGIGLGWCPG